MRFLKSQIQIAFLGLALMLSACAYLESEPKKQPASYSSSPKAVQQQNAPDFILSSGDRIRITVFGDEDLSAEYDVDTRGFITMPLIGDFRAADRSVRDVQNTIVAELDQGFIVDPKVSIEVISLRPFYILGEVNEPGNYPTVPEMDVFKAIATAGGLTPRAVKGSYLIYRGFGNNRVEIPATDATPVYPGDSIKVRERFF